MDSFCNHTFGCGIACLLLVELKVQARVPCYRFLPDLDVARLLRGGCSKPNRALHHRANLKDSLTLHPSILDALWLVRRQDRALHLAPSTRPNRTADTCRLTAHSQRTAAGIRPLHCMSREAWCRVTCGLNLTRAPGSNQRMAGTSDPHRVHAARCMYISLLICHLLRVHAAARLSFCVGELHAVGYMQVQTIDARSAQRRVRHS